MLWAAYLAFLLIGGVALAHPRPIARIAALTVGLIAVAAGIGLTADAYAEGHSLGELRLTVLLAVGGLVLTAGAAFWRGTTARALRIGGFALTVGVMAVPSTLTLALPIAALAAAAIPERPHRRSVRRIG